MSDGYEIYWDEHLVSYIMSDQLGFTSETNNLYVNYN